jgi:hypothetical protein
VLKGLLVLGQQGLVELGKALVGEHKAVEGDRK